MRHVQQVHEQSRINCDRCGKSFAKSENLQMHISSVHDQSPKEYVCEHCHKAFGHKTQLYKHQYQVHNITKGTVL